MSGTVRAILVAQKGRKAGIDEYERLGDFPGCPSITTIDEVHKKIHDGKRFVACESGSLVSGAVKRFLITTDGVSAHFIYGVNADSGMTIKFYEAPTVTAPGTEIANYNRDRDSDIVSELIVKEDGTVSANGTLINCDLSGASVPHSAGSAVERDGFILKKETTYLLELTANANLNYAAKLDWYIE